jgi:hypothetical protein
VAKTLHTLKIIFSWTRSIIWALFITYWIILIIFLTGKLLSGGPSAVSGYLEHIGTEIRPREGDGESFYIRPFSWTRFAVQNIIMLVITLTLSYFELRSRQKRKSHQIQAS